MVGRALARPARNTLLSCASSPCAMLMLMMMTEQSSCSLLPPSFLLLVYSFSKNRERRGRRSLSILMEERPSSYSSHSSVARDGGSGSSPSSSQQQQTLTALIQRVAALEKLLGSPAAHAPRERNQFSMQLKNLQKTIQQREGRLPHLASFVDKCMNLFYSNYLRYTKY